MTASHPAMRRLRRQGEAPDHVKLSVRRIGYQVAALLAFLDAKTVAGTSSGAPAAHETSG